MMTLRLAALVAAVCISTATAHMCLYQPPHRQDGDGVLTEALWNSPGGPLPMCKRNINVGVFANNDTAEFGHVCGGNNAHPGNSAPGWERPQATNFVIKAGEKTTLQWLGNRVHVAMDGSRSSWYEVSYSLKQDPTENDDFTVIARVMSNGVNDEQMSYDWNVPEHIVDGKSSINGVVRVILVTGHEGLSPRPVSLGGVSNTYTDCSDVVFQAKSGSNAGLIAGIVTASIAVAGLVFAGGWVIGSRRATELYSYKPGSAQKQ